MYKLSQKKKKNKSEKSFCTIKTDQLQNFCIMKQNSKFLDFTNLLFLLTFSAI